MLSSEFWSFLEIILFSSKGVLIEYLTAIGKGFSLIEFCFNESINFPELKSINFAVFSKLIIIKQSGFNVSGLNI